MILDKIDDPRSPLEKARRAELIAFARDRGVKEIKHDMPATLIRKILRAKGITDIRPPMRQLGQEGRTVVAPTLVTREGLNRVVEHVPTTRQETEAREPETIDADELLAQAYEASQTPKRPVATAPKRSIAALRNECKTRGLKQPARATAEQLEALLNVEDAS